MVCVMESLLLSIFSFQSLHYPYCQHLPQALPCHQLTPFQIMNKTGGDSVHLDLSPDAFSQLADKSLGEIDIKWAHVACPITTLI